METDKDVIGFVSSSIAAPANESHFDFIIRKEYGSEVCSLNQFDLVKVERILPSRKNAPLYAVIESVSSLTDSPDHMANYVSQNFGTGNGIGTPRTFFYSVSARVLRTDNGDFFPVKTGDKVFKVTAEEAYHVLYANYEEEKDDYFNVAKLRMYGETEFFLKLNKKYLVGPDAVHLNLSGMSGMASKTTKALTILREMFHSGDDISIVIFNTKDNDLLHLKATDDRNTWYQELESGRSDKWDDSIEYFRPLQKEDGEGYVLDFDTQRERLNIDLLTAMDPDTTGTMDSCVKLVYQHMAFVMGEDEKASDKHIDSWKTIRKATFKNINKWIPPKFQRVVSRVITDDSLINGIFYQKDNDKDDITKKLRERLENTGPCVTVIDIAPLDNLQQGVVFGAVMREIKNYCREQQQKKEAKDRMRMAVFVDEFNKYASMDVSPRDPILESLIDIAEAGRNIGLCLVTAEQSLSIINRRIKANYSNQIIGRTGVLELAQPDFAIIPESYKTRIGTFRHGDALVYTTYLNSGLLYAEFPNKFYK